MNPSSATLAPEERLADADITAAIELLFRMKKGVSAHFIHVATDRGLVKLTGSTTSLLSRERAEEIAKAVRGVRGVINELLVRTPVVPDADLLSNVEKALAQDPATADYNVRCFVHDGTVLTEGTVQSWAEQQLVLQVLKSVHGVRQIENRLHIRGGELTNSDDEITAQIRALLEWDIRVKSTLVTVRTDHGVVHVAGTVGTAAERDHVLAVAYMAGATRVEARDLFVAYWALDKELRNQKFASKADEDIAQAIRDMFGYDPRVRAFEPGAHVSVHDGVATLSGVVSSLAAKRAAGEDAANVVGVFDVRNLLQVRAYYPSPDAAIQRNIKAALARDAFVGHYGFTVNVSNGKAQLYGTVHSHSDQERAEDVAAGVNGVIEVDNHLQVFAAEHFTPAVAAIGEGDVPIHLENIEPDHVLEKRLRNHYYWSARLHDQDINLLIRDGRVTLTGTVDSLIDRKTAATEAYACGARDVNNHLHLRGAA
ncbi:BON domain-containing protein [Hymenobacter sp. BT491]|uniref:BON domain-containing protein n=1 Tax=Hymenobacter sp. BT491 TaxID=2766779 RepID=UPI0016535ABB|nr:BON domain-containing protein [Hymenobacter sp. BT491]MBC6990544.1 BON domain-containing protein [Hymenobacter sp. BT491]